MHFLEYWCPSCPNNTSLTQKGQSAFFFCRYCHHTYLIVDMSLPHNYDSLGTKPALYANGDPKEFDPNGIGDKGVTL